MPDAPAPADTASLLEDAERELQAAADELELAVARADDCERSRAALESTIDGLLAATPLPVIVIDRDLKVWGWSRGAEEVWSLPAADVIGRAWPSVVRHLDEIDVTGDRLDDLLRTGQPESTIRLDDRLAARLTGEAGVVSHLILVPVP